MKKMKFENFQVFADGLHKNHLVPHIARLEEEEKKGTLTLTKKNTQKKGTLTLTWCRTLRDWKKKKNMKKMNKKRRGFG